MAVAVTSVSTGPAGSKTSPQTWSHNATGANVLIVSLTAWSAEGTMAVTFNGVSMTNIVAQTAGSPHVWVFKLINPDQGNYTISASWTGGSIWFSGHGISFSGADGGVGTPISESGNAAGWSLSRTVTANDMVLGCGGSNNVGTIAAIHTARWQNTPYGYAFGETNTGSGSVSVGYTDTASDAYSFAAIPILATTTVIKTINGLAKASVKTVNGLAIASVKTWNGLA